MKASEFAQELLTCLDSAFEHASDTWRGEPHPLVVLREFRKKLAELAERERRYEALEGQE